ncbi:hypothetical protein [Mycobacterium talmoniae]|uniref:Uncharacterized protein n=1 Tax=Mycobacterium talmoniae TaxID=1858794 RepID=A0A1S1NQZ9_9MYCO|nr:MULTISPECIES: hypothetical protein [Mycobacterium]OHV06051.1 hypothetical protein BKN37_03610 [Mycobacterium talmoniae]PQM44477.1 hypothetical protein C1Y40_05365 [Mycobacterium talmoniae]TDH49915.1 hypothetical protein E2F47_19200 [Mycobacterium eburneum]
MTWPTAAVTVTAPPMWPAVSLAVGSVGLLLAGVPHYVGLIGAAAGGFGVAAGMVGVLLRGHRRPALAVSGITVSVLAVLSAGVMTFVYADLGERAGRSTTDTTSTQTVLRHELGVQIGTFSYQPSPKSTIVAATTSVPGGKLMVTLTNKLAVPRAFYVTIAAFENKGVQITSFTVDATLDADATRQVNAADRMTASEKTAERLTTATFTVLAASSAAVEKP